MPISIITGGSLSGAASNGNSVTLTFPVGVLQNDVVYVGYGTDGVVAPSTAGYTSLGSVTSGTHTVRVYRKVMGATPDANVVINGTGQAQDALAVVAYILRDVDLVSPQDATTTTATGTGTVTSPSITTVTRAAWVLPFASGNSLSTPTAPSGYIGLVRINAADNNDSTSAVAYKIVDPAGSEVIGTWGAFAPSNWGAITVAVRPSGYISVPVTGVSATGQTGTVTIFENEVLTVTGVTSTGQTGTVITRAAARVPTTGVTTNTFVGTVLTRSVNRLSVTGFQATSQLGVVTVNESVKVDVFGVLASGATGEVLPITGFIQLAIGVQATAQVYGPVYFWYGINDNQPSNWQDILT